MRRRPGTARLALVLAAAMSLAALTACEPAPNPPTTPGTRRIVMYGDSIPSWMISAGSDGGLDRTKYTVINAAVAACDASLPFYDARWGTNEVVPVPSNCPPGWRKLYPPHLQIEPDVAVIMGGVHAMLDHRIDGTWVHPCRAAARSWYYADIKARLNYLKAHASRVVLVLPAWPGPNSGWIMPADYVKRANCVREEMVRAATVRRVPVVDFGAYVCPASPTACEDFRHQNGIHVDAEDAAGALRWILEQVAAA